MLFRSISTWADDKLLKACRAKQWSRRKIARVVTLGTVVLWCGIAAILYATYRFYELAVHMLKEYLL